MPTKRLLLTDAELAEVEECLRRGHCAETLIARVLPVIGPDPRYRMECEGCGATGCSCPWSPGWMQRGCSAKFRTPRGYRKIAAFCPRCARRGRSARGAKAPAPPAAKETP